LDCSEITVVDSGVVGMGSLSNIALSADLKITEAKTAYVLEKTLISANDQAILVGQTLIDVWAWLFFAMNTTMTTTIIYKIWYVGHYISDPLN
jgi:hypothetical protein